MLYPFRVCEYAKSPIFFKNFGHFVALRRKFRALHTNDCGINFGDFYPNTSRPFTNDRRLYNFSFGVIEFNIGMEEYIGSGLLLYLLSRNILRNPKVFAFLHQQKEWRTEIYKKILQSLHHKNKKK